MCVYIVFLYTRNTPDHDPRSASPGRLSVDEQREGLLLDCTQPALQMVLFSAGISFFWVAVKELKLSYHNPEAILVTIYPYYGNLISVL